MEEHVKDKFYPHYSEKYMHVTKWCSQQFPKFDADKIIKLMREKNPSMVETNNEIKDKWKESAMYGTLVHSEIEQYYKKNITQSVSTPEFHRFIEFTQHHNFKAIRSEWKIYDDFLKICGCLDMLYKDKNTGEFVICDWKTTKNLSFF